MLVTVSSVRGAPGVSSWALALATAWPHDDDRILVEADCSGGVVGCRYDVAIEPGVADLVSQARRGRLDSSLDIPSFARHLRSIEERDSQLWVSPEPLSSHEAMDIWRAGAGPTAEALAYDSRLWVADCGRVWSRSPVEPLLAVAPLNILVSDGSMPSLLVLRSRVDSIPNRVAILVIGDTQYSTDDLLQFTGADYVWTVPYVKRLDALAADFSTNQRSRRSKIWRTVLKIAHTLADDLANNPMAPPLDHSAAPPPPPGPDLTPPGAPGPDVASPIATDALPPPPPPPPSALATNGFDENGHAAVNGLSAIEGAPSEGQR